MVAHGATVFTAVPTMYVGMLEAARRSPARPPLRYAVSGGAALPVAVLEAFRDAFGAEVHEGYGLTETVADGVVEPAAASRSGPAPSGRAAVGRRRRGRRRRDRRRASCCSTSRSALGEIVVRGHNLFKGYLGRPEASAAAVVDGWFRTGDLGTYADGIAHDRRPQEGHDRPQRATTCTRPRSRTSWRGTRRRAGRGVRRRRRRARGQEVHAAVVAARRASSLVRGGRRVRARPHRRVQVPARRPRRRPTCRSAAAARCSSASSSAQFTPVR